MDDELVAFLRSRKLESSAEILAAGNIKTLAAFHALSMGELKRIGMKDLAERKRVMLVVRETVDDMVDSTTDVSVDDSTDNLDSGSVTFSPRIARSLANTSTQSIVVPPLRPLVTPLRPPPTVDTSPRPASVSPRVAAISTPAGATGSRGSSPWSSPRTSQRTSPRTSPRDSSSSIDTLKGASSQRKKGLHWLEDGLEDMKSRVDISRQSVASTPATDSATAAFRDALWSDHLVARLREPSSTLWEQFVHTVRSCGKNKFLGTRLVTYKKAGEAGGRGSKGKYEWRTYEQIEEEVLECANGLETLGFTAGSGVAMYLKNRKEYIAVELASYALAGFNTAVYDTLGDDSVKFIVNHSGAMAMLCSEETLHLVRAVVPECPNLRLIVCADPIPVGVLANWNADIKCRNVHLMSYDELLSRGRKSGSGMQQRLGGKASDLACIMYTSGTTGQPKGVLLTHANFVASVSGILLRTPVTEADRLISYLPLSHVLERSIVHAAACIGAEVGFYSGDVKALVDDIQELRPTIISGVPRVFEKIYASITTTIENKSGLAKKLFSKAFVASTKAIRSGKKPPVLWEKLVFSKIKKNIGGRVRLLFSGGAPLNKRTQDYLSIVFGCPLLQGYGLTETCGAASVSYQQDGTCGHNGPPCASVEIRLIDVPEMNYFHTQTPPTGEICIRGPSVSAGYHKDVVSTSEVFDLDGWFHTGDIGRWTPSGTLQIIDRRKNIFKLAQGLYVAVESLEGVYALSPFVNQLWIPGDSSRSFIVAVIVPAESFVLAWAEDNGHEGLSFADLCAPGSVLEAAILLDLEQVHRDHGRPNYEIVRGVILESVEWTTESGLMTPTMKLKRPAMSSKYMAQLARCFEKAEAVLE